MATYPDDLKPINKLDDDEILQRIQKRVGGYYCVFKENIDNLYEDALFSLGRQWQAYEEADYIVRKKVYLTVNLLRSYVMNIVGQFLKSTPQIKVLPRDENTSQKEINLVEGLLRHIAYDSESELAYQMGLDNSLFGFGGWRVGIDYEDTYSTNRKAIIIPIPDIRKAYFDPSATHPTKKDARYGGVYVKMTKEELYSAYNVENPISATPPSQFIGENYFNWVDEEGITVVEHFEKVCKNTKLHRLSTGEMVLDDQVEKKIRDLRKISEIYSERLEMLYFQMLGEGLKPSPPPPVKKIKIEETVEKEIPTIYHYKATKDKILERGVFPGEIIPIVFVDGSSNWFNGKQETMSFIRFAKDPQKFFNLLISELANMVKTGHKGEYLATEKMIRDYKEIWRNPEKYGNAKLYTPDTLAPDGRPVYIAPAELPQSIVAQGDSLINLVQHTLGRFEANKGEQSNEMSGVAITNRAKQGDATVFKFLDNVNKAIEQTNKILLEIIPDVYGKRGNIRTRGEDGKIEIMGLDDDQRSALNDKKFDVQVTVGAPFDIQKGEQLTTLTSLAQALPDLLPAKVVGDLIMKNTNLDNTPQLVDRIRQHVVDPNVLKIEKGEKPEPPAPDPVQMALEAETKAKEAQAQLGFAKLLQDKKIADNKIQAELLKAELDYHAKTESNAMQQERDIGEFINKHLDRENAEQQSTLEAL